MKEKTKTKENLIARPPVVVVIGHVDHGKSTLLDYIRKTNIVEKEAGGITQHISAYEVIHEDENKQKRKITFLDTPGHEAFSKIRERGAQIADIAILIVSAEDGVKPQTIEAWKTINQSNTPCIVAINKMDKPGANLEKTKNELAENEIYLEGYGGKIPFVPISAKDGTGINELLTLVLIIAEMEDFKGNTEENASGSLIETNLDSKRGIQATVIIKNGTLKKGMVVVVGNTMCSTKMMENYLGESTDEAVFSSPIRLTGFDKMPNIGETFKSFKNKKEALNYISNLEEEICEKIINNNEDGKKIIGIVLKADATGSLEAIEKEIEKIKTDNTEFRIIQKGIGPISESDVKDVASCENVLIIGFNVKTDKSAVELAEKRSISLSFFDIIYKMTEWLNEELEKRRLRIEIEETQGQLKIIKSFSQLKDKQVLGGKIVKGTVNVGGKVKIIRRTVQIGLGKILNLEKGKSKTSEVEEGSECGIMVESKIEIVPGDILESFILTKK